jgi:hypothetical protein
MSVTRRSRLSLVAAAASGALVVTMAGTALAADGVEGPTCAGPCESVPALGAGGTDDDDAMPETTPAAVPEPDGDGDEVRGDRDCAGFGSQADAQAAFEENEDDVSERLDADDDGIACEDHFDTEGRQVAVYPEGGVATGGPARP